MKRPLPLYGILIQPGYYEYEKEPWLKNNRVAALEITLNDEQTFTETIPDERFERPYLIRVRDYTKPVNKIKLVIKGVHRGTQFRDTCISLVELRAPLTKNLKFTGAMKPRAVAICCGARRRHRAASGATVCPFTSKTITPARFIGWRNRSISTNRTRSFISMRTATHRAFSIPTRFVTRFETLRLRRIAKRCSIAGAAKALSNASTGSSRSCRRRLKKSFGCRLRNFLRLKFANTDNKQRRCSTAISKQRRGNRDHYTRRTLFPISNIWRERSTHTERLIVTIDLDYFAGLAEEEREQAFARIWNFVIEQPNLLRITFAISRPYLKSEDDADRLLELALTSALSLPTAQIEFEPFLTVANDHSNLAKKLIAKGEKPPAFDVAQSLKTFGRGFCPNVNASTCGTIARAGSNCCVPGTTKRRDCILKLKIASLLRTMFGVFQPMSPPTSNWSSSPGPRNRERSNGLR